MSKSIAFFFKGVLTALVILLVFGLASALLTTDRYHLTTSHSNVSTETLNVTLKHGQAKLNFVSRATRKTRVIAYKMHGLFLRFGNHYVIFTTDDSDDVPAHNFAIRKLFIEKVSDTQAFLITDRRGSFTMKDGTVIYLNSVFTGTYR